MGCCARSSSSSATSTTSRQTTTTTITILAPRRGLCLASLRASVLRRCACGCCTCSTSPSSFVVPRGGFCGGVRGFFVLLFQSPAVVVLASAHLLCGFAVEREAGTDKKGMRCSTFLYVAALGVTQACASHDKKAKFKNYPAALSWHVGFFASLCGFPRSVPGLESAAFGGCQSFGLFDRLHIFLRAGLPDSLLSVQNRAASCSPLSVSCTSSAC